MPGLLAKPRKGWENEQLASFLLSRIAFVSRPVTVADDVGSDFFCTLFEATAGRLLPTTSFAIQIKSRPKPIVADKNVGYFKKLDLPLLVGIVNQSASSLTIYSGEFLPILFCYKGIPDALTLKPVGSSVNRSNYFTQRGNRYTLQAPRVLTLKTRDTAEELRAKGRQLEALCTRIHQHIAAWRKDEYVFHMASGDAIVMAGEGSAPHFRRNFQLRLAEVFRNLEWLKRNRPKQFSRDEFEEFSNLYNRLKKTTAIERALEETYESLLKALKGSN